MQSNLTNGVIYKGSDAEISVPLFPRCMTVTDFSGLTVDFFTAEGGHSIHYDGDSLVISGQTATVHFQWEALNGLSDGLLRYNVSCTIEDKAYTMDMETRWYLKTPSTYIPQDFVSKDEVVAVVDEAMTGYTRSEDFSTIEGMPLTDGTDIQISRVEELNGMNGSVKITGTNVSSDTKTKTITIEVPTKTSQLTNDSGYLTEHQKLKTINNQSIVGSGNIEISGGTGGVEELNGMDGSVKITGTSVSSDTQTKTITIEVPTKTSQLTNDSGYLTEHQELKTINNQSIVGSGNIEISGGKGNVQSDTVDTIWTGTQAEYDALGTYSDSTLYIIKS